jgi:hypothetical protein
MPSSNLVPEGAAGRFVEMVNADGIEPSTY